LLSRYCPFPLDFVNIAADRPENKLDRVHPAFLVFSRDFLYPIFHDLLLDVF